MVLRLLLVLILVIVTAPVAAGPGVCHEVSIHRIVDGHGPAAPAPAHACIGCIPLGDWHGARLAAPPAIAAASPVARVAALPMGRASPPMLRPPRTG